MGKCGNTNEGATSAMGAAVEASTSRISRTFAAKMGLSRRGFVAGAASMAAVRACVGSAQAFASESASNDASAASAPQLTGTGSSTGRKGAINVRVILTDDKLTDILTTSDETPGLGTAAIGTLTELIIEGQTLNVDAISGATITSMAFLSAVEGALDAAGQDGATWREREAMPLTRAEEIPAEADVVVIGSGVAGMAAAITAANAGKSVVVLEKLGVFGGNSIISGAGYAVPGSYPQLQRGVEDSPELMAQDMLVGGDNEGDPALVQVVCDGALDALQWLIYENGVSWSNASAFEGGHSVERETAPNGRGEAIMCPMFARAQKLGVAMCASADVQSLVVEDGTAKGVVVLDGLSGEEHEVRAASVVIATGGFSYNVEMRSKYNPELDGSYGCTNCVGAMGDGIVMAQEAGAGTADLEYIQVHPTCSVTTGEMLSTGSLRGGGRAILVNKEGKRFVEELERRDVVSSAILAQTGHVGYFVFSKGDGVSAFNKPLIMETDGQYAEADTLDEACEHFGIDAAALRETMATWDADAKAGTGDSAFNYRAEMFPFPEGEAGPWVIFSLCPSVHYTMGGITIDPEARVLDADGTPIAGLFAAGETCGNIMGTNRLGCTSYPNAVVFGRVAGASAAANVA